MILSKNPILMNHVGSLYEVLSIMLYTSVGYIGVLLTVYQIRLSRYNLKLNNI